MTQTDPPPNATVSENTGGNAGLLRRFVPIPVWQGTASPHGRVSLMALSAPLVTLIMYMLTQVVRFSITAKTTQLQFCLCHIEAIFYICCHDL